MRARFVSPGSERLDKLLAAHTSLSRKRARQLIERGGVRVDGQVLSRASAMVGDGALVEVHGGAAPKKGPAVDLVERFRDRWLLVVDKPCGLPTQPTREGHALHLYGILDARERYVGLHHRLDTPASGLVLVTLDRGVNKHITDAFRGNTIHRRYLAVVLGDPGEEGSWRRPIDGSPAVTHWRRLSHADGLSVLMCSLETGRTHQIRRHAAESGFPIAGDRRYGSAAGRLWPRLALHAQELCFVHPMSGDEITVESVIPEDLADLVERAGFEFAGEE